MIDCLLIGFNDSSFPGFVEMVRSMGADSGAYRDLNLAFIEHEGQPRTSMDMLNRFRFEDEPGARQLHNCDFLWPAILYLGTFLHRRGFTFDYVNTVQIEKEKLREKLLHEEVLTVAITTTLYVSAHPVLEIIELVRQYNDKVKIVVGGPYISNQAKLLDRPELLKLFDFLGADYYVISQEGEQTLANLLSALKEGGRLSSIGNLSYREGREFVINPATNENNSLEENMIDYSLFPRADIGELVSVRTAKSCPFSCSFCGFPQRAGDYRYLSVELVEKELNALADLGVTTITFLDDTFNVPKRRFREILELMIRHRYDFRWNSFYRSDHGDEHVIDLMAQAGCEGVFLGIESGSDGMLKTMNKTARRQDYLRAIPQLQSRGISAHANVIVGFPGETLDSYAETLELIEETAPDFYRAQLWYADPVTPIWNRREEFGVKGSAFSWSHATMDFHTACDWVDRLFLCVESSIWLPQNGFEQWSTFYLQRKGMSREQIKAFLRTFNALIKEKLVSPPGRRNDPALVESLRRSARPDWTAEAPADDPLAVWSGSRYIAAETFWFGELAGFEGASAVKMLREATAETEGWQAVPVQLDGLLVDRLQTQLAAGIEEILLAAFAALMSRTNGHEDLLLVAADGTVERQPPLPLRLRPAWDSTFRAFLDCVRESLHRVREHSRYGLHLLTNPSSLARVGLEEPVFELGFAVHGPGEEAAPRAGAFADWPRVAGSLALVLETRAREDRPLTELVCRGIRRATAEQLAHHLAGILQALSGDPDLEIGAISTDARTRPAASAVAADAAELFDL